MFIDANIFILGVLGQDALAIRSRKFLKRLESGEQNAMTSVMVLGEVLKVLNRKLESRPEAVLWVRRIMAYPNLKICGLERAQFDASLPFFSQGLKPYDALHAATMREHGICEILSFDSDFDKIDGIRRAEP